MIHNLRIPCPVCKAPLVDLDLPCPHNWVCLWCSMHQDTYGERKHVMDAENLDLILQDFLDAVEFFDPESDNDFFN